MSESTAPHIHRVTLVIACIGVVVAGYSLWRNDRAVDREALLGERLQQLESARAEFKATLDESIERERQARSTLEKQYAEFATLPKQVKDLVASHEDLRARTERPQRAWSRAEALYLIELAQRRLSFDHDVTTAIVALEAADSRLAGLRDASLHGVRERLAGDIQALRAIPDVDRVGIMSRIAAVETQSKNLTLKGVLAGQRNTIPTAEATHSMLGNAWASVKRSLTSMFVVKRLSDDAASTVTLEEQSLLRQHTVLLSFSARLAVLRSDQVAYRAALTDMQSWLAEHYAESPAHDAVTEELSELAATNIAPPLPNVAGAADMLLKSGAATPSDRP